MRKLKSTKIMLAFLSFFAMVIFAIEPARIAYAEENIQKANETEDNLCGCVLDDGLTVFDAWKQNAPKTATYTENQETTDSDVQVVNEVVVFIRFADESADIYERRGGMDYIMGMYNGESHSLKANLNEFSWGKAEADTYFWPQENDGTPICYVDGHPVSYYMKKSDSNPNGYTSSQKASRRQSLLKNVISFMGSDFLEKLGIEGEPYNLVFMVPDCENWNDLLWSHKSSISVNGTWQTYNLITYQSKSDVTRTITHEFMHSYGYPDMYHYYNNSSNAGSPEPLSMWSIMAYTGSNAGHPTVYEKYKYGEWVEDNGIQTITQSGRYLLSPSTEEPSNHTIAYKIPVEGVSNQYFMVEYRGSDNSGFDTNLGREGLICYRVNTSATGNSYGPPDEVFVLREDETYIGNAYYNGSTGKTEFSNFKLYNDEKNQQIKISNIKKENEGMSFDIDIKEDTSNKTTIYYANSNWSNAYIHYKVGNGQWTTVPGVKMQNTSEQSGYTWKYNIDLGDDNQATVCFNNGNGSWDSRNGANYTVSTGIFGIKNQTITSLSSVTPTPTATPTTTPTATPTITSVPTVTVTPTPTVIPGNNQAVVYYGNDNWNSANIHYQVGNGSWTTVPGVKMEESSAHEGYSWKYVIDLGDASNATVCFNNGNNSWDSKNGSNYTVGKGTYGIKNGSVNEMQDELEVSVAITGSRGSSSAIAAVNNGTAPYTYSFVYTENGQNPQTQVNTSSAKSNVITITSYNGGTYKVDVVVTDAEGKTGKATAVKEFPKLYIADINTSLASPQKTGTTVTFTADIQSEFIYKFPNYRSWSITKDGQSYASSYNYSSEITYTFKEAGTYNVTCSLKDATGQEAEKTIQYVISDETNVATIYYSTGWENPYIHYCIGSGAWTNVPGVKMQATTEKSGYNYKFTVDLQQAESVTVCFNNGSGSWDSRNGANYTVKAGTYGVKNGVVTSLE